MPEMLTATYRIVTPMFIGDAHQEATEITAASVKGALRFWWRALNWGRFRNQPGASDESALKALHTAEAELFGTAGDESDASGKRNKTGQAKFLIRVASTNLNTGYPPRPSCGTQYLAGQGLFNRDYQRSAVLPQNHRGEPVTFEVRLALKPGVHEASKEQLRDALLALGILGGLGSRSRHGLGSIAIEAMNGRQVPQNADDIRDLLNGWQGNIHPDYPPFTAFSGKSCVQLSVKADSAAAALEKVGQTQQLFRGYGLSMNGGPHKVCDKPAHQNFRGDHKQILDAINGAPVSSHPQRAIFGLPHNYFFSSVFNAEKNHLIAQNMRENQAKGIAGKLAKADVVATWKTRDGKDGGDRRASPLFIHIHQFPGKNEAIAIQTLLPAVFLPKNAKIRISTNEYIHSKVKKRDSYVTPVEDWTHFDKYFRVFTGAEKLL